MASIGVMRAAELREVLARNQKRFQAFLRTKLGNDAPVEDVLHSAYVRAVENAAGLESADSVVPWFYRILSNEVADHFRRVAREGKAIVAFAREQEIALPAEPERNVCRCVTAVLPTLKPAYAAAVTAVDVDSAPVEQFAQTVGITSNNASVRLHRARASLRERLAAVCGSCAGQGCFDCSCTPGAGPIRST